MCNVLLLVILGVAPKPFFGRVVPFVAFCARRQAGAAAPGVGGQLQTASRYVYDLVFLLLLVFLSFDLIGVLLTVEDHNTSLRELDALKKSLGQAEKKAEVAISAKERLELELATAAEAKERLQQEATDREEQLATAAPSHERKAQSQQWQAAPRGPWPPAADAPSPRPQ